MVHALKNFTTMRQSALLHQSYSSFFSPNDQCLTGESHSHRKLGVHIGRRNLELLPTPVFSKLPVNTNLYLFFILPRLATVLSTRKSKTIIQFNSTGGKGRSITEGAKIESLLRLANYQFCGFLKSNDNCR